MERETQVYSNLHFEGLKACTRFHDVDEDGYCRCSIGDSVIMNLLRRPIKEDKYYIANNRLIKRTADDVFTVFPGWVPTVDTTYDRNKITGIRDFGQVLREELAGYTDSHYDQFYKHAVQEELDADSAEELFALSGYYYPTHGFTRDTAVLHMQNNMNFKAFDDMFQKQETLKQVEEQYKSYSQSNQCRPETQKIFKQQIRLLQREIQEINVFWNQFLEAAKPFIEEFGEELITWDTKPEFKLF